MGLLTRIFLSLPRLRGRVAVPTGRRVAPPDDKLRTAGWGLREIDPTRLLAPLAATLPFQGRDQPRSTPPVRFETSATIFFPVASISSSVIVFSRGCKVTAIATDVLPGSMPLPS